MTAVRLCHLYPEEMNIYADRGNIAVLERRLAWRGLGLEVTPSRIGEPVEAGAHDLYYLGGGQDRDQEVVARDMAEVKAAGLRAAVEGGAAALCVCGGYQLAGHGYTGADGARMPGIGILDLDTVAGPTRLIGDLVIEAELDGVTRRVVGFENHAGRTRLGPGTRPLGRVVSGHGNNGDDRLEGAVSRRVIGTYLHGPLLPKNPWIADTVIAWALEHRTGERPVLEPLDDSLEEAAHAAAVARATRSRR
ncbi:MAG: type 1 glutamine amidotransferase [Thermoleophilia bacterium]